MALPASVLVVDDEAGLRSVLASALRGAGWRVDAVVSGEDCLERTARRTYDVILLDVRLPGLDGLAALEALREQGVESHVIVMSGHGNVESAVRAIKMGAFDFIEKPFPLDKAVLVTRNALRQRRLEAGESRVARARRPAVRPGRREPRDRPPPEADRGRRSDRRPGADRRGERHRQGARRPRRARTEPPLPADPSSR